MSVETLNKIRRVSVTPTITSGVAYAAGQALGGKLTFSYGYSWENAGVIPRKGYIVGIQITELGNQQSPINIALFNQNFTATADKSSFNPSAADLLNLIDVIKLDVSDWINFASNRSVASHPHPQGDVMKIPFEILEPTSTNLYGQMIANGTPTYAGTADLTISLMLETQ